MFWLWFRFCMDFWLTAVIGKLPAWWPQLNLLMIRSTWIGWESDRRVEPTPPVLFKAAMWGGELGHTVNGWSWLSVSDPSTHVLVVYYHNVISRWFYPPAFLQGVLRTSCAFCLHWTEPIWLRDCLRTRTVLRTCRIIGLLGVTLLCHYAVFISRRSWKRVNEPEWEFQSL